MTVDVTTPTPDPIDNLTSTKRERSPSERSLKALIEKERAGRQQAEQQAARARDEAAAARYHQQHAQLDGLLNAIGASQSAADAAEQELANAYAMNDAAAMAKAQRKLSKAQSDTSLLEQQKTLLDQRQHQARHQQQRPINDIETALGNMPGLYGAEMDWLRKHPDLVLDQTKNRRLTVYFDEAIERGLDRGSPQFQQYLESRLGIADHAHTSTRRDDPEPRYAAPVSRNGSGLDLDPSEMRGKVTLSPAQVDAARMAGISLDEYARQVLVL